MWPSSDFKKFRGFKIGLISALVVAVGIALAAMDLVGTGRILVILGVIGGFIGFAVHIGEMLEEHRRSRR
jgi:hypothetical protein